MTLPKKISEKLITLFRDAVKTSGSYAPEDNLMYFEESLTMEEATFAWAFFTWVNENDKKFGHNLPDVYQDFVENAGQAYITEYWAKGDEEVVTTPKIVHRPPPTINTKDLPRQALDASDNALQVGDKVLCIDDMEGGDSSSEGWDIKLNSKYVIDDIYDDENLLSPMICLKGSENGPTFPNRFKKVITAD